MKGKTRAQLRGAHLLPLCEGARISQHEYGPDDYDRYCYGMYDRMTEEPCEECRACGAFVENIPMWGEKK